MHVRERGFTLLELLVTLAIVAILFAMAVPLYSDYMKKIRRESAQKELLLISSKMEKYKQRFFSFVPAESNNKPVQSLYSDKINYNGKPIYLISIPYISATEYVLTATPINAQAGDGKLQFQYLESGTKRTWDADDDGTYGETW